MDEYAALLRLAMIGVVIAGVLVLFHVRVVPRRPAAAETQRDVELLAALSRFHIYAALFVAFVGLALLLTAWAARVDALGPAGLGVAALVAAPLLVGFAHLIACGDLGDDDS